jgi:hypothetical protein
MSHLMTNAEPCGIRDGHRGHHRSAVAIENDRQRHRDWIASYRLTAAGMLADIRNHAKQRQECEL